MSRPADFAWALVFRVAARRAARLDKRWAEPAQSPAEAVKVRTAWLRERRNR